MLALVLVALPALVPASSAAADPAPVQAQGAPGWLGVSMDGGGPDGVTIQHLIRSSPADKAGLKEGDRIVRIEGTAVVRPADVSRAVATRSAGDKVSVVVSRAGAERTFDVTLEARPSPDDVLRMDRVGAFAPAWVKTTTTSDGPATIASLRGRVVLLDFWATWCGACRLISPKLSALQAKYGAQGLSVVGITTETLEQATAFKERTQMRYPVVSDAHGKTSVAYGVSSLPTLFVIDKRGVVREVAIGYDPSRDARLEALLQALLAEPAPTK
jgi:peroxiredoxin